MVFRWTQLLDKLLMTSTRKLFYQSCSILKIPQMFSMGYWTLPAGSGHWHASGTIKLYFKFISYILISLQGVSMKLEISFFNSTRLGHWVERKTGKSLFLQNHLESHHYEIVSGSFKQFPSVPTCIMLFLICDCECTHHIDRGHTVVLSIFPLRI